MNKHLNKRPLEFRQMLEARLKKEADKQRWPVERARKRLAFERFLVRVQHEFKKSMTLKGGMALELRLERARATLDVDLHVYGEPAELLMRLNRAGGDEAHQAADRFSFLVSESKHAEITSEALEYGGARFSVRCNLDDKEFESFPLDVSFAEEMFDVTEELLGWDVLEYLDVGRPRLQIYPLTTHIAEKLHAYTLPRVVPTRLKDLPDIALLAQQAEGLEASRLLGVINQKFELREQNTRISRGDPSYAHPVPTTLRRPPEEWTDSYAALASAAELPWATLIECHEAARVFLDPLLNGAVGRWSVAQQAWI